MNTTFHAPSVEIKTSAIPLLETLSDEQLVERCKAELPAEMSAYSELFRRYHTYVFHWCNRILNSVSDAEEVSQDVLLQVLKKIEKFEGRSSFKTWLSIVTRNYCNNRLSKMIRVKEGKNTYKDFMEESWQTNCEEGFKSETGELVRETVNELTPNEKLIITMKYIKGLTLNEISDELGVGLSATKMRLYRAMEAFKLAYIEKRKCAVITRLAS